MVTECPCKTCEKRGCGNAHDTCPQYQEWLRVRALANARKRAESTMRIEAQLLKNAPAAAKITPPPMKLRHGKGAARAILLAVALALLLHGYFTGGTADVLTKAANICTECIGLG